MVAEEEGVFQQKVQQGQSQESLNSLPLISNRPAGLSRMRGPGKAKSVVESKGQLDYSCSKEQMNLIRT